MMFTAAETRLINLRTGWGIPTSMSLRQVYKDDFYARWCEGKGIPTGVVLPNEVHTLIGVAFSTGQYGEDVAAQLEVIKQKIAEGAALLDDRDVWFALAAE